MIPTICEDQHTVCVKAWLMIVEKGFTFTGGCSGSMCRGSTPFVTYHLDDEISSARPRDIVCEVCDNENWKLPEFEK